MAVVQAQKRNRQAYEPEVGGATSSKRPPATKRAKLLTGTAPPPAKPQSTFFEELWKKIYPKAPMRRQARPSRSLLDSSSLHRMSGLAPPPPPPRLANEANGSAPSAFTPVKRGIMSSSTVPFRPSLTRQNTIVNGPAASSSSSHTPYTFIPGSALAHSRTGGGPQLEHDEEDYYTRMREWKMDCATLRAAGKDLPPEPTRKPAAPASIVASSPIAAAVTAEFGRRRRPPMGLEKHKSKVEKRTEEQTRQLIEAAECNNAEALERRKSREAYALQVERATEAMDPSPMVPLTLNARRRSRIPLRIGSGSNTSALAHEASRTRGVGSGSTGRTSLHSVGDLDRALRIAKISDEQPQLYRPSTLNFDKMRAELEAQLEANEDLLEGKKKKRKRMFPTKLDAERQAMVNDIFGNRGFSSAITSASVAHKDISRLRGTQWLNDEIITFYAQMLNLRSAEAEKAREEGGTQAMSEEEGEKLKKVHVFNSFFYKSLSDKGHAGVKRWTRKIDLFAKDVVIIPINLGNSHWVCAAINMAEKRIEYYDSMGNQNIGVYKRLRSYLEAEYAAKNPGKELDLSDWENYWDEDVPIQDNAFDCGIYTCQFMECLSRHVDGFDFDQSQMPYFRNKMVLELAEQRLIPEPWGPA